MQVYGAWKMGGGGDAMRGMDNTHHTMALGPVRTKFSKWDFQAKR